MDFSADVRSRSSSGRPRGEFVDREVVPHARDWDRDGGDGPRDRREARRGRLPRRGWELDTVSYCLVMEELGRGRLVGARNRLRQRRARRQDDQALGDATQQRASGSRGSAPARRSAATRSPSPARGPTPRSLTTRAERDGDDWVITGSKIFITLGTWAGLALVFARTGGEGARGITCFLVPTDSEGFSARPIKGKLGLRAQDTGELFLDGVRVPASAHARRRGRRLQGRDVGTRQRTDLARGRLRRDRAGLSRRVRRATPRNGSSSASRSPRSSSSRSCSPTSRSRPTRRGC